MSFIQIQTLGEEGNIDEAEALTKQVESLKNEREDLKVLLYYFSLCEPT